MMHLMTKTVAALACLPILAEPSLAWQDPPIQRPPTNALRRYEPKLYDIKFEVLIKTSTATNDARIRHEFNFDEAPIVAPVIYQGAYSKAFPGSEGGGMIIDTQPVPPDLLGKSIIENKPFNTHLLRLVAPKTTGGLAIRWNVGYRMQSWNADIDERLAQQATWPRDMKWPAEAEDGLKPQLFIESDDPVFAQIVASNGGDRLRTLPPHIAAKEIVRFTITNFQINGDGALRGYNGDLRGLRLVGARQTVANPDQTGRLIGSEHDLVCVCVAMLRAANIPARPVIGIFEDPENNGRKTFITWAEYYLPGSGWVSFDPHAMYDNGAGQYRNVGGKWRDFGSMDELNERVPLSYFFLPPASGVVSPGAFPGTQTVATWGWDPRPEQRNVSYEQSITLGITSRGKGQEDPR